MRLPVTLSALCGRFFMLALLAFVSGIITHFGFAPYEQQWASLAGLFSCFALLHHPKTPSTKQALIIGLSFGFGLFIAGLRWVHVSLDNYGGLPIVVTLLLLVLLALYLALYPALACYVFTRFKHKSPLINVMLFTSAWVVSEYLRGVVLTGFPWLSLGYSQTQGIFSGAAATVGVLGLTGIICLLASLSFYSLTGHIKSVILLCIVSSLGYICANQSTIITQDESVNVALVQGNIKQSAKWDAQAMWPTITRYMDLTREHFDSDVIIWPEAAMPAVEGWVRDYLKLMDSSASFNDSAIITGIIGRAPKKNISPQALSKPPSPHNHDYYNAIMTLGNATNKRDISGIYQPEHTNRYYKHQLLPIGEFVPFESLLRPLAPLFNLPMSSFTRGDAVQPNLVARGFKFAPAICYEIVFGELLRANMKPDTQFLLTISNDAWFGQSIGPHQHMQIAQMRAIELGRPLIRVTNTGISAIVDTTGKIVHQLPQFEEGVLRANIHVVTGDTFFYRYGQMPWVILFSVVLLFSALLGYRQRAIPLTSAD